MTRALIFGLAVTATLSAGFRYDHIRSGTGFYKVKHTLLHRHKRNISATNLSVETARLRKTKAMRILNAGSGHTTLTPSLAMSTIEYDDTVAHVPCHVSMFFNKKDRLFRVQVTWNRATINTHKSEDQFVGELEYTLTRKYGQSIARGFGDVGGIVPNARREWEIDHHDIVFYKNDYQNFHLIYSVREHWDDSSIHRL